MRIQTILTACNENPSYYGLIPDFCEYWKLLYPAIQTKIVLVMDSIPALLKPYEQNIILFPPIPQINTAFQSQIIRLFYPAIIQQKQEGAVMITDIDMMPMSSTFFNRKTEGISDDKFVYFFGDVLKENQQFAMCYNAAIPAVWSDVFGINSVEDVRQRITDIGKETTPEIEAGSPQWFLDQRYLHDKILEWHERSRNFISLPIEQAAKDIEHYVLRLNRTDIKYYDVMNLKNPNRHQMYKEKIKGLLTDEYYWDYHCVRSFEETPGILDFTIYNKIILDCIREHVATKKS